MVESSAGAERQPERTLAKLCARLEHLVQRNPDVVTEAALQRETERAVAVAVAHLQGTEPVGASSSSSDQPTRPILARDLLLSADLVLRSLRNAAQG